MGLRWIRWCFVEEREKKRREKRSLLYLFIFCFYASRAKKYPLCPMAPCPGLRPMTPFVDHSTVVRLDGQRIKWKLRCTMMLNAVVFVCFCLWLL